MRLYFSKSAPQWLRRLTRRWVRRLNLDEWKIEVLWEDAEAYKKAYGEDWTSSTASYPQYFSAHVTYPDNLTQDDHGIETILHELRHPHYAAITALINYCWDGRRRVSRQHAHKMFDDLIEQMIERDVAILRKAYRNK